MGRSIERIAVGTVVFSVSVLTIVGLMAIWDWIDSEALWKSFSTIGVIGATALVVVGITRVAGRYYKDKPSTIVVESSTWKSARNFILSVMGIVFLFFAALSIMAIWDFVGEDELMRSLGSMGLLFVSSSVILAAFKSQMELG